MMHRGIIDSENEYMKLRVDDYPAAADILTIFNFKRDKTAAYDATAAALAQGLVIWPKPLNIRNEMEFEEQKEDGSLYIRYEKPNLAEVNALIQIDLAKTELQGMQKSKRPNGTIVYEQTPEAKQNSLHDDRADGCCLLCWKLMQLRSADALDVEKPSEDFKKIYGARLKNSNNKMASKKVNPFIDRNNPFRR